MPVQAKFRTQRTVTRGAWVNRFKSQKINYRGSTKVTAPTLSGISPSTGVHNGVNTTVTCTGTGFVTGMTKAMVNGVDQTTTFVSATSCTFVLALTKYPVATTLSVNVRTGPLVTATPRTFTVT